MVENPEIFSPSKGQSSRRHSKQLDKILGFHIPRIEQKLLKKYRPYYQMQDESNKKKHFAGTQTWIGLHPQVLQTPYGEIYHFLSFFTAISPKKIVDLGAGYGRVGIVMQALFPDAEFLGLEILDVRINEALRIFERLGIKNCAMENKNILDEDFVIPQADIYFIYDFSGPDDVRVILNQLAANILQRRFFIVAKGEGICALLKSHYPDFLAVSSANCQTSGVYTARLQN